MADLDMHCLALSPREIAMFTKLLVLPPRHVLEHGWPSSKWLERQEFKIENGFEGENGGWYRLTKRLERDVSTIKQVRVILAEATGFQRDKLVPPRADVCWVHRSLSPFIVAELFKLVTDEVTLRMDRARNYRGDLRTPDLDEFLVRISGINSLWLTEDMFDEVFCNQYIWGHGKHEFPETRRFLPLMNAVPRRSRDEYGRRDRSRPKTQRSCEACVLAFIGARGSMLSDLRANMLARSRIRGRAPRLLPFVEAWIGHFGKDHADQLRSESENLACYLEAVVNEANKEKRQSREARRPWGKRDTGRNLQPISEGRDSRSTRLNIIEPVARRCRWRDNRETEKATAPRPRSNWESRNDFLDDAAATQYYQSDYNHGSASPIPSASHPATDRGSAKQGCNGCDFGQDNIHQYGRVDYSDDEDDYDDDGQYTQIGIRSTVCSTGSRRPSTTRRTSIIRQTEESSSDSEKDDDGQYIGSRSHWRMPNKKEEEQAAADEELEHDETLNVETRLRAWSSRHQLRPETPLLSDGTEPASGPSSLSHGDLTSTPRTRHKAAYEAPSFTTMPNLSAIIAPLRPQGAAAAADGSHGGDGYESDSWKSVSVITWVGNHDDGNVNRGLAMRDVPPPVPRIPSMYREQRSSRSQSSSECDSFHQLDSSSSIYSQGDVASLASLATVYTHADQSRTHLPVSFTNPFAAGEQSRSQARSVMSEVSVRTPVLPGGHR